MPNIDQDDFESWLREQKYAERTVQDTVMAAEGILRRALAGEAMPVSTWARARRVLRYGEERGAPWADNDTLRVVSSNETLREASRQNRKRKLEAKSFDDAGWRQLADAVVACPEREARILELVMLSGLRIGDTLRIKRKDAYEALETNRLEVLAKRNTTRTLVLEGPGDPLYDALARALAVWAAETVPMFRNAPDMARWIIPDSNARLPIDSSRKRCYALLRELGKAVGLKGRVHLHRMRRTVAVQALRSGADTIAVGQLLGHKPGSSATLAYLDEARLDDVASTRKKIHDRFLK